MVVTEDEPLTGASPRPGAGKAVWATGRRFQPRVDNQSPFVNVFRAFKVESGAGATLRGDVRVVVDDLIAKRVLAVNGAVPTSAYVMIPKGRGGNAGLTGRFLYLQVRVDVDRPFLVNLEVDNDGRAGRPVRVSLGSLIKAPRSPEEAPGPSAGDLSVRVPVRPEASGWHVLCVDLEALMQEQAGVQFRALRSIQLCASLVVRNCFTSPYRYSFAALPQDMVLSHRPDVVAAVRTVWVPHAPLSVEETLATPAKKHVGDEAGDAAHPTSPGQVRVAAHGRARSDGARLRTLRLVKPARTAAESRLESGPPPDRAPAEGRFATHKLVGYASDQPRTMCFVPGKLELVIACQSLVLALDLSGSDEERADPPRRLFRGHAAAVSTISFSSCGRVMATAEEGPGTQVRVWDYRRGTCLAVLQEHAGGLSCLHVSPDACHVAAVGLNAQGRHVLAVWKLEGLFGAPESAAASLEAKGFLDHPVAAIKFSPFEALTLVSCGSRGVRTHRVRHGSIRHCSIRLEDGLEEDPGALAVLRGNEFTDLDFDVNLTSLKTDAKYAYVAAASGHLVQINLARMRVESIMLLHGGPVTSLAVVDGVCATGSSDHLLRLWLMDFTDFVLEAEHEGPVTCISMAEGGRLVAAATVDGTVGVLDTETQGYTVLMRSHRDDVTGLEASASGAWLATRSRDMTVRAWDAATMEQACEFLFAGADCTALRFSPTAEHELVAGFADGKMQVLDVRAAAHLEVYHQHREAVRAIQFSSRGSFAVTAGNDGYLVIHDVRQQYLPVKYLQLTPPPPGMQLPLCAHPECGLLASLSVESRAQRANVLVFHDESLEPFARIPLAAPYLAFMCFTPSRAELACVTVEGDLLVFNLPDGCLEFRRPRAFETPVVNLFFDETQSMILAATDDARLVALTHPLRVALGAPPTEEAFLTDTCAPLTGFALLPGVGAAVTAHGRTLMRLTVDLPEPDPLRAALRDAKRQMVEAGTQPPVQSSRFSLEGDASLVPADPAVVAVAGPLRAATALGPRELCLSLGHAVVLESLGDGTRTVLASPGGPVAAVAAMRGPRGQALALLAVARPDDRGRFPILVVDRPSCRALARLVEHRAPVRFLRALEGTAWLLSQDEAGALALFDVLSCACVALVDPGQAVLDAQVLADAPGPDARAEGEGEAGAGGDAGPGPRAPQLHVLLAGTGGLQLLELAPPRVSVSWLHACRATCAAVRGAQAVLASEEAITVAAVVPEAEVDPAADAEAAAEREERARRFLQAFFDGDDGGGSDGGDEEGGEEEREREQRYRRMMDVASSDPDAPPARGGGGAAPSDAGRAGTGTASPSMSESPRSRSSRWGARGRGADEGAPGRAPGTRATSESAGGPSSMVVHRCRGLAVVVRTSPTELPSPQSALLIDGGLLLGCRDGTVLRYRDRGQYGGLEMVQQLDAGGLRVWAGPEKACPPLAIQRLERHEGSDRVVAHTPFGLLTLTPDKHQWTIDWLLSSAHPDAIVSAHQRSVLASWGSCFWVADETQGVSVWTVHEDSVFPLTRFGIQELAAMDGSQDGDDSLTCMCLARTGDVLCVGRLSGDVAVLNSVTGRALWEKPVHSTPVLGCFFNDRMTRVVTIDAGGVGEVRDTLTGESRGKLRLPLPGIVTLVEATPHVIVCAGEDFVETFRVSWDEADVPKLKKGSQAQLSGVTRVAVLSEAWVLVLAAQLYLLSAKDSQLIETEVQEPCSVLTGDHDVLVGTRAGRMVRIDPRDNLPTRAIDVSGLAGGPGPVFVLLCTDSVATVLCNGVFISVAV